MRAWLAGLGVLLGVGCYSVQVPPDIGVGSFQVSVQGVYLPQATPDGGRPTLPVVTGCTARYGSDDEVPLEKRGTADCPYVIPNGTVEIDVTAVALDTHRQPMPTFARPVAFRVVPGDLALDYRYRFAPSVDGTATGRVRVDHVFGQTRIWAEDAPPQPIYADGGVGGKVEDLPEEPAARSFATGLSPVIYFEEPTLANIQRPDVIDNRSSPMVGQFLAVGRPPESGGEIKQSCPDDPEHDGKPLQMVVTGLDPSGFYVTDLTGCRLKEPLVDPATGRALPFAPEPSGFLPGTYGSIYVYNYNIPDGLYPGDLLSTLSGSVQEFTSTTQLTFPSWTVAEHVRELPFDQWKKWLDKVPVPELNHRLCGAADVDQVALTDQLCGHNRRNLKVESLESTLVRVRHVRLPQLFRSCDLNGDGLTPQFCETFFEAGGCPTACGGDKPFCNVARQACQAKEEGWRSCDFTGTVVESANDIAERLCLIDCIAAEGEHRATLCSERTTYNSLGQYLIELPAPGPATAGLDDSLPKRLHSMPLTATSTRTSPFPSLIRVAVTCTAPARVAFGHGDVEATAESTLLPAGKLLAYDLGPGEQWVALKSEGAPVAGASCSVTHDPRTRLSLVTRDAIPQLQPDCDEASADPAAALACRATRAATYDIVGYLKQIQPARPRWSILPRDADDVCCHPGEGLECPPAIKRCTP